MKFIITHDDIGPINIAPVCSGESAVDDPDNVLELEVVRYL